VKSLRNDGIRESVTQLSAFYKNSPQLSGIISGDTDKEEASKPFHGKPVVLNIKYLYPSPKRKRDYLHLTALRGNIPLDQQENIFAKNFLHYMMAGKGLQTDLLYIGSVPRKG
jgi:hypothetical protein